ncbi:MAG: nucleotidyltransferase family protein [Ruminococcaceae bacterium]|nr:nucleotidyltransferase family protein [Oscillospiraceae bacterium]
MKTVGIISEYNPFHNGHKYQTDILREMGAERIVAVMGGTFSQRGSAHIIDKYSRAEIAVASGSCDCVLELPYPYSCTAAEYFARAGVYIASQFCDSLAFGCEEDDPGILKDIAELSVDPVFRTELAFIQRTNAGTSMPRLAYEAFKNKLSKKHADATVKPNNLLAIEYLKAIIASDSSLEPVFIKRKAVDHDSDTSVEGFSSASNIRKLILNGGKWSDLVPKACFDIINGSFGRNCPIATENAERAVLCRLRELSAADADGFAECSGGLGRRIIKCAKEAGSLNELYSSLATKRYTNARIRRAVISCLTGVTESDLKKDPSFTFLLAANKKGLEVIRRAEFTLYSLPSAIRGEPDHRAAEIYLCAERLALLCYPETKPESFVFSRKPAIFGKI